MGLHDITSFLRRYGKQPYDLVVNCGNPLATRRTPGELKLWCKEIFLWQAWPLISIDYHTLILCSRVDSWANLKLSPMKKSMMQLLERNYTPKSSSGWVWAPPSVNWNCTTCTLPMTWLPKGDSSSKHPCFAAKKIIGENTHCLDKKRQSLMRVWWNLWSIHVVDGLEIVILLSLQLQLVDVFYIYHEWI